jgi:hypothetical protein
MTWQDSLRQLDARLANGEIGAAEYRKTRDEILAEASSGSQAVSFDVETTSQWVSTPPSQPPASAAPTETDAETTQIVSTDGETTQVVPAAEMVTTPPPPGQQPFGPPGGMPGLPPPPPHARQAPIVGPEVFAEISPSSGGKRVLWFLVPLLVLALVGGGVWWFLLRDDSTPTAGQDQEQQTTTTTTTVPESTSAAAVPTAADIAKQVPELPGQAKPESGTMTPEQAQQQKLLPQAYAALLANGGAKEIVYNKSAGNGYGYLLIAAPVEPSGKAGALAAATSADLQKSGFTQATAGESGPPVFSRTDKFFRTFVAMYSAGDVWVQLNVSGAPDSDENALRTEFDKVLQSVVEQLPAG